MKWVPLTLEFADGIQLSRLTVAVHAFGWVVGIGRLYLFGGNNIPLCSNDLNLI